MKKGEPDVSKFEKEGLSFKAKLIGIEDVPEARGDQMCQEALLRLKNAVKASGEHKQKISVNVTLEGLKIVDAISLEANKNKKKAEQKSGKTAEEIEESEKDSNDGAVLHSHAVHRISFISRDTTDSRAFGYIYGDTDNTHKFFAIKTAAAAEQLVYTIRDLFQAVYDLKKKEMEDAKTKLESGEVTTTEEGNSQTPGNGSTSGTAQTPQTKANADGDNIYSVPPNNAPVKQAEQVANLLDLEDQTEHILKGIEQIKNLDFDSITDEQQPTSPVSPPVQSFPATSNPDPWGMAAATPVPAAASTGSALGDLAGLQTSPFPMQQPFPGATFPMQTAGFGAAPAFGAPAAGLPVTRDPFANDPFTVNAQQRPVVPPQAGGFPAANPFGAPQPFGGMAAAQVPPRGMMPGAVGVMPGAAAPGFMPPHPYGVQMQGAPNPFGVTPGGFPQIPAAAVQAPQQGNNMFGEVADNPNLLQPLRLDDGSQKEETPKKQPEPNQQRNDLFGDLILGEIKKDPSTAKASTPKDLFAMQSASEKKSMNQLMSPPVGAPTPASTAAQNSAFGDAFGAPVNGNASEQSPFN